MNSKILAGLAALLMSSATHAQSVIEDFKPSEVNQQGKEYPMVNSEGRVRTQISAPDAKYVSLTWRC